MRVCVGTADDTGDAAYLYELIQLCLANSWFLLLLLAKGGLPNIEGRTHSRHFVYHAQVLRRRPWEN